MTDRILPPLATDQKKIVRKEVLRFNHRLEETGLFTDEALARLLDEHPRDLVTICTMQPNPPADQPWIAGEAATLTGAELVEAARKGALWVSPRSAMTLNPRYKVVFDQLMGEFSKETGLPVLTADAAVLISSPRMGIFFHVDPAETMLWHVRGHKTIHVYPPRQDIVTEAALEAILVKENLSDLPWTPALEDHGLPVMLAPGQAAFWPQHSPHRVVNGEDLNVSISVEFSSPQSMLTNSVFYTHARMRRMLGWAPTSRGPARVFAPAHLLAAKALKTWAPPAVNVERAHARRFDVDLSAPGCVRWRKGMAPDWAAPAKPARKTVRRRGEALKAA
ncbi:MAG: hypothetical protein Q8L23_17685 [Caulobacter sp.]|nr:hypothetical protein [Caulobacter sp.]